MEKKGFTLVELLAVIVILAIIALIAVPIIMNIVESSRKSSATSSAYGYIKGINITYANELLLGNDFELDGLLRVDANGLLDGHKIDVEGTTAKGGYLIYKGSKITQGCLTIGDYKVSIENDSVTETIKGKCEDIPKATTFADDSWATIIANVRAGNTDAYKVGDTKEVALNGFEGTYTLRIANTSTPSECSQEGFSQTACGFVIEFEDIIIGHPMNSTGINKGGWEASDMRKYINDTIYNSLPEELKKEIIDTRVISGHGQDDIDNFETTDKLYLLSPREVWGDKLTYDTAYDQTRQLDYYLNKGVTTDNYSGAIKGITAGWWWLRGAPLNHNDNFYTVNKNGSSWNSLATDNDGVAPAFRIG